jgi:hypothetical protein
MKKLFVVLFAVGLIFGLTGMSMATGPTSWSSSDGAGLASANYNVDGCWFGIGGANANVYAPRTGSFDFATSNFGAAGAYSGQSVNSDAWGAGLGMVKTEAYGEAQQFSNAGVDLGNGNWAAGSQTSGASYDASSMGFLGDVSLGNACTIGGTLAGAANFDIGNTTVGMSGAAVGSTGNAYAGCNYYDTNVRGNGNVEQASYAGRGAGGAWTHGTASYNYNNDGYHNASGAGFAATTGVSTVTTMPNGTITAHALSMSISTSGPVNTSGGVYIDTFNE